MLDVKDINVYYGAIHAVRTVSLEVHAGEIVSIEHFGESAAAGRLFTKYGFTAENVADKAKAALARR